MGPSLIAWLRPLIDANKHEFAPSSIRIHSRASVVSFPDSPGNVYSLNFQGPVWFVPFRSFRSPNSVHRKPRDFSQPGTYTQSHAPEEFALPACPQIRRLVESQSLAAALSDPAGP